MEGYRACGSLKDYRMPPVDEAFIRGQMEILRPRRDQFYRGRYWFSFSSGRGAAGMENLLCDMLEEPNSSTS
ncbi:MAG: hypothetical protein ACLUIQ_11600 [Dialister invisus]